MTGLLCNHYAVTTRLLVYLVSWRRECRSAIPVVAAEAAEDDGGRVKCFYQDFWADNFNDLKLVVHRNGDGAPHVVRWSSTCGESVLSTDQGHCFAS